MKRRFCLPLFIFALLLSAQAGNAQVIQKSHCANTNSCSLENSVAPGDMLVVINNSAAQITDTQGNTFFKIYASGWYGTGGPLWYATGAIGGSVTIQLDVQAESIFVAEYPPAKLDQVSKQAFLCCARFGTVGPMTVTAASEVLIAWAILPPTANVIFPPSSGFTTEDSGSIIVEDERVGTGTYSATFPQSYAWGC